MQFIYNSNSPIRKILLFSVSVLTPLLSLFSLLSARGHLSQEVRVGRTSTQRQQQRDLAPGSPPATAAAHANRRRLLPVDTLRHAGLRRRPVGVPSDGQ